MSSLTFLPLVPLALWSALALAAAALLATYARDSRGRTAPSRRRWIIGLMGLGLLLPMLVLLNPTWVERIPPPGGKPLLTILIDASASMAANDGDDGRSRFDTAKAIAARSASDLSSDYDVAIRTFSAESALATTGELAQRQPDGQSTDLATAIDQSLLADWAAGQAMLVLSDGIHNAGGLGNVFAAARRGRAMAAPIFTRAIGGTAAVRDLDVQLQSPQELSFVGQTAPVSVLLRQQGLAGNTAQISLWQGEKEVAQQQMTLGDEAETVATFQVGQPNSGLYTYEVRVAPVTDEVTELNNTATLVLRVIDEPIRVLLLEGKPYWDTRFLVRTLAADPSIELVTVVRMAEGRLLERVIAPAAAASSAASNDSTEKEQPAKRDPAEDTAAERASDSTARQEQWKIRTDVAEVLGGTDSLQGYQLLVLGRDADVFLTPQALDNIKRWLGRDGGSLVCFRGAPATQVPQELDALLPVRLAPGRETRFRVQMTDRGRELRWLTQPLSGEADSLAALPALATAHQSAGARPLAVVLAASLSDGGQIVQPVISHQPFGSGQTIVVEGAGMWRWAFMAPEFQRHEAVYGTLWQSLIRWIVSHAGLLPTQQMLLRGDKVVFSPHETATATMLIRPEAFAGEPPSLLLEGGPLPEPRPISAHAVAEDDGVYRVVLGSLPEGRYQLHATGELANDPAARAAFDVRPDTREQVDLTARPDILARLSQESGGEELSETTPDKIAQAVRERLQRNQPDHVRRTPAWDRWWVLAGICAVWATAWGVRRASGLV
ncbi:MAG: hypothetical protein AB7O62_06995 [Pirellulales bacterium]